MRKVGGKELAVYQNFTYYCHGRNQKTDGWSCTASGGLSKCRARLIITKDRKLKKVVREHNHAPPQFLIQDGVIIKI